MNGTSAAVSLAARYDDRLAGIPGLGLPRVPQWAEPVWHLYVVRTEHRAELIKALDAAGIGSLVHYPIPPHLQQAYADLGLPKGSFPLAETLADTVLSLPIGPHVSLEFVDEIAAVVRRYMLRSGARVNAAGSSGSSRPASSSSPSCSDRGSTG